MIGDLALDVFCDYKVAVDLVSNFSRNIEVTGPIR